jgi:SMC interacting uncharacterized protein involved in chromosome segregation
MPEVQQSNGLVRTARLQEEERAEQHEKEAKEIVQGIDEARRTIEQAVSKLAEMSQKLRTHALRQRNDLTSGYLAFSNAHMRICGALSQGLRRTASMGRVLESSKLSQEEAKQRDLREEEQRRMRAQNREIEKLSLPTNDDFDLVYGSDEAE